VDGARAPPYGHLTPGTRVHAVYEWVSALCALVLTTGLAVAIAVQAWRER
jgi:hypothetical protein